MRVMGFEVNKEQQFAINAPNNLSAFDREKMRSEYIREINKKIHKHKHNHTKTQTNTKDLIKF
jgi:hypothetical protein